MGANFSKPFHAGKTMRALFRQMLDMMLMTLDLDVLRPKTR